MDNISESFKLKSKIYFAALFKPNYFKKVEYDKMKTRLLKFVKSCKDMDDIKLLRKENRASVTYMENLYTVVVKKDTENSLYKKYKKNIENGNINPKELSNYIKWLKNDYPKAINEKSKQLKK